MAPDTKRRKIAIYARVSTEHEAQLSALENQKDWYITLLKIHTEWDLVQMYVDEGITGTQAYKRPQFLRMIEDAKAGNFEMIVTREVSRFARNTMDTLQYTRELKKYGIEVFFSNDNISTFSGDGELRLTIMATLAQEESRKTSLRVKAGQQISMQKGTYYGNGNILGYDRVKGNGKGKDTMVINPEQARTVRMIFDAYLDGMGVRAIQFMLEKEGRLTATGKTNWHAANISKILQNAFYCGIITYHKEYVPDFLEQKKVLNHGEIKLLQVQGTHVPIITKEEFELVQRLMNSRRQTQKNNPTGKRAPGKKPPSDVWTRLLRCECGHQFNRKVWHRLDDEIQYGYQCYSSIRTGSVRSRTNKGLSLDGVCRVPMIPGWKLKMMAKYIFSDYIKNTEQVLLLAQSLLEQHIDDPEPITDNTAVIEQKEAEAAKLRNRLNNLTDMRLDGEITKEEFAEKKEEIERSLTKIYKELETLRPSTENLTEAEEISREEKITILKYYLERALSPLDFDEIPENVIEAFVEKIVVHPDGFDWYLRFSPDPDPTKITIDGKRKNNAIVSTLCNPQDRPPSRKADFPVV